VALRITSHAGHGASLWSCKLGPVHAWTSLAMVTTFQDKHSLTWWLLMCLARCSRAGREKRRFENGMSKGLVAPMLMWHIAILVS
jgi:hypothetical protein